jgi:hypothetical protein
MCLVGVSCGYNSLNAKISSVTTATKYSHVGVLIPHQFNINISKDVAIYASELNRIAAE